MNNQNIDSFYDFINMYNLIIKHCAKKNSLYDVKLYYINNSLYFKITDKNSGEILHNDSINCSKEESKQICYMITNEFILNHKIKYSAYLNPEFDDTMLYTQKINGLQSIRYSATECFLNENPIKIHALENSIFTLKIYLYDGIDNATEYLHQLAMEKAYGDANKKLIKK